MNKTKKAEMQGFHREINPPWKLYHILKGNRYTPRNPTPNPPKPDT